MSRSFTRWINRLLGLNFRGSHEGQFLNHYRRHWDYPGRYS